MTASLTDRATIQMGELVVRFGRDMDELARWELRQKEWCPITVEMNGRTLDMQVISLVRFQQETNDDWKSGRPAVIEVPTLIVESVDFDNVVAEVERLYRNGWFSGRLT